MSKRIIAIVLLTIFVLSTLSGCKKPENSANGDPLVPGAVTTLR